MSETATSVKDRVRSVVTDVTHIDDIKDGSHFLKDEGLDSLDHIEIVIELEKEFNVRIPDDESNELMSIDAFAEYLEREHKIV